METVIKEWNDFQVIGIADDGETALSWLHEAVELPDLLITDIFMQYMDGMELIKRVNNLYPQIKCAILSGHEDFQLARRAIELKVCQYITKPVESEALLAILEKIKAEVMCEKSCNNYLLKKEQNLTKDFSVNSEDVVEKVIQYIYENYKNSSLSLQELAEVVSVHPNYLTQLFTKRKSIPCMQFLTQIRMDKAKELLRQSDIKISEVAKIVGYENPLYFSSYFKKWVGMNPSKYREAL